ncbi:hypothetical protein LAZ40_23805 [Cereibacter sphaeroides]|uniref:hypothetical protein n=1 Tax=Cereibacter sphaeroides TaxID=1063 RepID=UPI001F390A10|nr:hypothetical protein [Cereibacter sphaeroides]MCE6962067.1 hypothetical protein [Cereibacter sphaeroides]MCE6970842.1 hypothetical protein [Cereibacter sphaeroides]MCE6975562.1 hypothetical protein [Cereibacter sphaeroides]
MTDRPPGKRSRSLAARLRRLVSQPFRSMRYKALFALESGRFLMDPADFADKRVLIIGAASCVSEELDRLDPADWDVIVRMNKAIDVPVIWHGKPFPRCDVLFHSFGTEGIRAAGEVTAAKLRHTGTHTLVHRTTGKSLFLRTLEEDRRLREEGSPARMRIVAPEFYKGLMRELGGHSPTTGATAICWFLGCNTRRLGIVGFTFYTTRYFPGYQDHVQSDADAPAYGLHKGIHDPEAERKMIARKVGHARAAGKSVVLGHEVERVLAAG